MARSTPMPFQKAGGALDKMKVVLWRVEKGFESQEKASQARAKNRVEMDGECAEVMLNDIEYCAKNNSYHGSIEKSRAHLDV